MENSAQKPVEPNAVSALQNGGPALTGALTLDEAIASAVEWLARCQSPEGYWVGPLQTNCCMEAEWVLAMHFLGLNDDPKLPGVIRAILNEQRTDGAWEVYHEAPEGDINTTVECYAALRCAGLRPDAEPLKKAREWILAHGGLSRIRNFTKFWLALIGEWPWDSTPAVPPELIFLPPWFPFNIYWFASWARATIVPISVLSALRPVKPLPPDRRLDELFPGGRANFRHKIAKRGKGFWATFFVVAERFLRQYTKCPVQPFRQTAIRLCLEWIIRHQDWDGAWGGIQPPWIYSLMALHAAGYPAHHPVIQKGVDAWNHHWSYRRGEAIYIQACESPVWDTLLTVQALLDCGETFESFPGLARATDWLLSKQIHTRGDWSFTVKGVECGGWAFERANELYPDLDDTAVAITVLAQLRKIAPDGYKTRIQAALRRAERWVLAMQSSNGGWAAFDKDNNRWLMAEIPFCDFGEVLDPPSADLTGHMLEALGALGYGLEHPAVKRAVQFLFAEQEADGSWFGRWGVNYIYGTAAVLAGLRAVGLPANDPHIIRAADWLASHQNPDGSWGESCASYMDDSMRGRGPATPSQTGWALIGLIAAGNPRHVPVIRKGVEWLIANQVDGTWHEAHYTGCGFPGYGIGERVRFKRNTALLAQGRELSRGFMINYHLYRHYFPLQALGRARRVLAGFDRI